MSAPLLFSSELYRRAVLEPARQGADRLLVVSGYATPSMVSQVLTDAAETSRLPVAVDLIVGMTGAEGIPVDDHHGFESLQARPPSNTRLRTYYVPTGRSVHTKLYVWLRRDEPFVAFAGSANFTHPGFQLGRSAHTRHELLAEVPVEEALQEYTRIEALSIAIDHPDLLDEVRVTRRVPAPQWVEGVLDDDMALNELLGTESVILPLVMIGGNLETRGQVHRRAGLNWGQREGREPNQAYIPVPRTVAKSGFFPPRGVQFLVTTDDNKSIVMVVAEQGDKALHSPQGNHLIGEYFRYRLGVPNGAPVTLDDLMRFGSRFVRFYKLGDDEYFMEYGPQIEEDGARQYGL